MSGVPGNESRREFLFYGAGAGVLAAAFPMLRQAQGPGAAAAYPGVFDVRAYGARGDGVADDTASIQRALDDAARLGGAVFIAPASPGYRIASGPLKISAPLTVFGTSPVAGEVPRARHVHARGSILLNDTKDQPLVLIMHDKGPVLAGVVLRDLYLRGNREVLGSTKGVGVAVVGGRAGTPTENVDGILLQNVTIKNAAEHGLWIEDNVFNNNFWGVVVTGCGGDGIRLDTSLLRGRPGQNRFIGCTTARNLGSGYRQSSLAHNWVYGLQSVQNYRWGIEVTLGSTKTVHSKLERNRTGAAFFDRRANAGCSMQSCQIDQLSQTASSIRIDAPGVYLSDITFSPQERPPLEIQITKESRWVHLGPGLRLLNGRPYKFLNVEDQGRETVHSPS